MDCPNCKLINPPGAILCDCGYDFERRELTRERPAVKASLSSFLPAAVALVTDVAVAAIVQANQPRFPDRLIAYVVIMLGAALLMAVPVRWVRVAAILVLVGGMVIGAMSVGILYAPTVMAAAWVTFREW